MLNYPTGLARLLVEERERDMARAVLSHELPRRGRSDRLDRPRREASSLISSIGRLVGLREHPAPQPCDPIATPSTAACSC